MDSLVIHLKADDLKSLGGDADGRLEKRDRGATSAAELCVAARGLDQR